METIDTVSPLLIGWPSILFMARIKNLMLAEQEVHSDEVISVPGQVLYPQLVVVQESQ